jgi:tripartite motif-containing protein 71
MRSWKGLGACAAGLLLASAAVESTPRTPWLAVPAKEGLFSDPEGLAIDRSTGTVFVADEDRHEIFALRPDGSLVARLATGPHQPVPGGLVTTGGSLAVVAPGRLVAIRCHDLMELTLDASGLRVGRLMGSRGSGPGQFLGLEGVAVDRDGSIYAAEEDTRRVQVLARDGAHLRSLPMPEEPEGVALAGEVVWVSFAKADWVGAYDRTTGALLGALGQGELDVPDAVLAVGEHVFVSDQGHDRVVVFTRDGRLVRTIGSGQLDTPEDLAIGPDGLLYVADSGNRRVAVYQVTGEYVRSLR